MPNPPRLVAVILVAAALAGLAGSTAQSVAGAERPAVHIAQEGIGWD